MPRTKPSTPEFISKLDWLPEREEATKDIRAKLYSLAVFYGFEFLQTSPIEDPVVFSALAKGGALDDRPVLAAKTKGGKEIILRSSLALSLIRVYMTHKMNDLPHPLKFFSEGGVVFLSSKREEAIGGQRELVLEMIGEEGPVAEAEIVHVFWRGLIESGIKLEELGVRVNATGCSSCRGAFRSSFLSHFRSRAARLCRNCKKHIRRSPTKVLVCEEEKCKIVSGRHPQVLDFLCEACKKHLRVFLEFLDEIPIPYFLDPRFFKEGTGASVLIFEIVVRRKVVFENGEREEETSLVEGGRISRAAEFMTGKKLDVVSGTLNMGACALLLKKTTGDEARDVNAVFFSQLGELAKRKSLVLIELLRQEKIEVRESLGRDSIKSQLKTAEKLGCPIALILGQKEALDSTIIVRETDSGIQETVPQEKLIEFLKRKLNK